MRNAAVAVLALLLTAAPAAAQGAVFIVRHAERADTVAGGATMMAADPELSRAGHARAESLAAMLSEARISAIFTSEYKRTRQTAAPLARALGIEPSAIRSDDLRALVGRIEAARGNVLVVGHSNTVPAIIRALRVEEDVAIGEREFDGLFIVSRAAPRTLLKLRYR